jgi:CDP-glycerol glycerophosphotransferase
VAEHLTQLQVVILAAGMGTRLGMPMPKPLTPLADGSSILGRQLDALHTVLGPGARVTVVVGFRSDMIMAAFPDVRYVYNERYETTNTSKSLLKALRASHDGGVLWLNGDVVFDPGLLATIVPLIAADRTFVCVNTQRVGDEEVKYTVCADGYVDALSKQIVGGLGEAIGVNFISAADKTVLVRRLDECRDQDYFERGLEVAIVADGMRVEAVDISAHFAIEVDFTDDLARANTEVSRTVTPAA